jgi:hypothetical protein
LINAKYGGLTVQLGHILLVAIQTRADIIKGDSFKYSLIPVTNVKQINLNKILAISAKS